MLAVHGSCQACKQETAFWRKSGHIEWAWIRKKISLVLRLGIPSPPNQGILRKTHFHPEIYRLGKQQQEKLYGAGYGGEASNQCSETIPRAQPHLAFRNERSCLGRDLLDSEQHIAQVEVVKWAAEVSLAYEKYMLFIKVNRTDC